MDKAPLTEAQIGKMKEIASGEAKPVREQMGFLMYLMAGVIFVLFIGFIAIVLDGFALVQNSNMWGSNTYQTLIKELDANNDKMDVLIEGIIDLRVQQRLNNP